MQVSCKRFDWQVSSAAQICSALWRVLPAVEELSLDFHEHGMPPPPWRSEDFEVDSRAWCELLGPFKGVKKLRVGPALALDLSRALHHPDDSEEPDMGMMRQPLLLLLPALQEIVLEEGRDDDAFAAFVDARQHQHQRGGAGSPIQLVMYPSRREPRTKPSLTRRAHISSQLKTTSLDTHLPGSYPGSPSMMGRRRHLPLPLPGTAPISSPISNPTVRQWGAPLVPPLVGWKVEQHLERLREISCG